VISQSEARSLEVPFTSGLNIIYGGNKTGKSSIIKSIFTTFGCECKQVEKDWKDIISTYILYFRYGDQDYCIVRENKKFQIFEKVDEKYNCLIETEHFHEYSNKLMEIFGVNMPCITVKGDQKFNITPPLLFRFQYIDQDEGWNKIAEAFSNVAYIKDWKQNTNKYVSGYLSEDYYRIRAEIVRLGLEKDEFKKELTYNQNFVSQISRLLQISVEQKDVVEVEIELLRLLEELDIKRNSQFIIKKRMGELENQIFVSQHKLKSAELSLYEVQRDINFAMTLDEKIICPTCGAECINSLERQLSISSDSALAEKLISSLSSELSELTQELDLCKEQYEVLIAQIKSLSEDIEKAKRILAYSEFYKNEGKQELYQSCLQQLDVLQKNLDDKLLEIAKLNEQVNDLKSTKRSKEIRRNIEAYCRQVAEQINIPKTFIKLRDFVQALERTGSETPRIVYMYQSALYLYNLERSNSPFNFLVIDTPNQQGQDPTNLQNIFKSLALFYSSEGQVILGTERKTGCEEMASSVLNLTEKRRCLTEQKYSAHQRLLKRLQEVAIQFVSDNYINSQQ
jgi:DNA repair exonuclease SbcCD ATPase subunit